MKKIIVYFHGYNSSKNSDKVARLRAVTNSEVYAFDIDIDPAVSIPALYKDIDMLLCDNVNEPAKLIFVGTSLGGWFAAVAAKTYGAEAVIINPAIYPYESLRKYGVSRDVLKHYFKMPINSNTKYFISINDEVLDHSDILRLKGLNLSLVNSDHRFNGPEFEGYVVHYIENLCVH